MSKMPHAEAVLPLTVASESAAEEALCRHWYEAHGSAVYNYFRFLVTAPDEAEELTAETFLRVVRHAGRFDDERGPRTHPALVVERVDEQRGRLGQCGVPEEGTIQEAARVGLVREHDRDRLAAEEFGEQ